MKVLVLQNNSYRGPVTQGNSRISKKSFGEDPVMMVYQRSEALEQTNYSLQPIEHWFLGQIGQKGMLCNTLLLPVPLV